MQARLLGCSGPFIPSLGSVRWRLILSAAIPLENAGIVNLVRLSMGKTVENGENGGQPDLRRVTKKGCPLPPIEETSSPRGEPGPGDEAIFIAVTISFMTHEARYQWKRSKA
jgi:hypothetical protein